MPSVQSHGAESGHIVGGRYRLQTVLGQGGMAVVWRAEHTETGRAVALKLVRGELAAHAEVREMFVREARVAARIGRNEHVVDVLDAGIDTELGLPFLAMELLDGETLEERLRRQGALSQGDCFWVLEQLAEALDQAHAAGVIHRDLKPQNLFLTTDRKGQLCMKVLDFGIAKAAETVQSSATQVGTPAYSAPEQLGQTWRRIAERNGRTVAAQVSPATDVWALGLVAYELFTGAPSGQFWGANTLAELPAKVFLEPVPPATARAGAQATALPKGFDTWLARCLDLDASKRWSSAGDAIRALRSAAGEAERQRSSGTAAMPAVAEPQVAEPLAQIASPSAPPPAGGASLPPSPALTALTTWANQRAMQIREGGDAHTYTTWMQFQFVPPIHTVVREGRLITGEADILIGEVIIQDELRRAIGEAHMLLALISSSFVRYPVAIKSKKFTGIGDGVARGLRVLDQLVSSKPKSVAVLGDQWFESRFEVKAPTPQEAHAALPPAARMLLVNSGFSGIVESLPGRLTFAQEPGRFDPASVDRALELISRLLRSLA